MFISLLVSQQFVTILLDLSVNISPIYIIRIIILLLLLLLFIIIITRTSTIHQKTTLISNRQGTAERHDNV